MYNITGSGKECTELLKPYGKPLPLIRTFRQSTVNCALFFYLILLSRLYCRDRFAQSNLIIFEKRSARLIMETEIQKKCLRALGEPYG